MIEIDAEHFQRLSAQTQKALQKEIPIKVATAFAPGPYSLVSVQYKHLLSFVEQYGNQAERFICAMDRVKCFDLRHVTNISGLDDQEIDRLMEGLSWIVARETRKKWRSCWAWWMSHDSTWLHFNPYTIASFISFARATASASKVETLTGGTVPPGRNRPQPGDEW